MLVLTEDGIVTPGTARMDLVTRGHLALWTEQEAQDRRRLTRKSVEQMIQRGRKVTELLSFLQERSSAPIPALLMVALQAWAGGTIEASLSTVVLLQCQQSAILETLLTSQALKPHLLGRIGPDAILVKSADVKKVKAVLDWAGARYQG